MGLFRTATRQDLNTIIDWAAAEGWNPGLDDADPFWAADPEGYWVSEDQGKMVAAISMVRHTSELAFLGFYIVAPEFRGKGIGWSLWNRAMATVPKSVVALDGVVAQQENYKKSGFAYAHANIRFGGVVQATDITSSCVVSASDIPVETLLTYDARHNPSSREQFMRIWLTDTDTRKSLVWMVNGRLKGLGTIRQCRSGFKIGPLFADNPEVADALFSSLVAAVGGGKIFLDIPDQNLEARALCERNGMTPVFETARMYRGGVPDLPLAQIYGITTFELG